MERRASAFSIVSEKLEKSIMKNDTQTGKALGPWPCKNPFLNHMLGKSGLKPQVKKHSWFFGFLFFFILACSEKRALVL